MPATPHIEKRDRRQQRNRGRRAIAFLHSFHIGVRDGLMLKRCFFGDQQSTLLTMIEGAEITAPQCVQVVLGKEYICCTESPLGVAIVNGRDTQATQFQYASADVTVVPQGIVEGLEARP